MAKNLQSGVLEGMLADVLVKSFGTYSRPS